MFKLQEKTDQPENKIKQFLKYITTTLNVTLFSVARKTQTTTNLEKCKQTTNDTKFKEKCI